MATPHVSPSRPHGYDMVADFIEAMDASEMTTSRPWRHSIGRISCAVRVPIYAIAATFQVIKMAVKFLPAIPISIIQWALGTKALDNWSFRGVALEGAMALKFLDKMGSSILGVIFAPPKKYYSLAEVFEGFTKVVVLGKHQDVLKRNNMVKTTSIAEHVFKILNVRVSYKKIIFQQNKIYDDHPFFGSSYPVSYETLNKVKSG